MTRLCLCNSLTLSGDGVGMASRSTRTLNFTSTSFLVVVSSNDLASTSSFSWHSFSWARAECFLYVRHPLDNAPMSLLQAIKVGTDPGKVRLCKINLLSAYSLFLPYVYQIMAQEEKLLSLKTSRLVRCSCNPPPSFVKGSYHHNVTLSPCILWAPPRFWFSHR